jgi:glycosyltransferase involved in cell wall biosynthesis
MTGSDNSCDITIIIPTHNRDLLLRQAVDSVLDQPTLAGIRLQIIVVDDCSAVPPRELLAGYGSEVESLFLPENVGQNPARNAGIARARGRYLKFLDSDDILMDGSLAQEFALAEKEQADMLLSGWGTVSMDPLGNHLDGTERRFPAPEMAPLPDTVLLGRAVPTSAALYRRSYLGDLLWDPLVLKLTDWDWFCQAALKGGKIVSRQGGAYWWRQHSGERETHRPRISTARNFYLILGKIESQLAGSGQLTQARGRRLAQYYYKELRTLCTYDRPLFYEILEKIRTLDPEFVPRDEERQLFMRLLARIVGTKNALLLHTAVKKGLKPEKGSL